jgi:hypothetical protein
LICDKNYEKSLIQGYFLKFILDLVRPTQLRAAEAKLLDIMPMYRWATSNFSGDAGQQYVRSRAQKFIRCTRLAAWQLLGLV